MNFSDWCSEVESIVMHQLSIDLHDVPGVTRKIMKKAWQDGTTPDQFVGEYISTHQEREEFDLKLEL